MGLRQPDIGAPAQVERETLLELASRLDDAWHNRGDYALEQWTNEHLQDLLDVLRPLCGEAAIAVRDFAALHPVAGAPGVQGEEDRRSRADFQQRSPRNESAGEVYAAPSKTPGAATPQEGAERERIAEMAWDARDTEWSWGEVVADPNWAGTVQRYRTAADRILRLLRPGAGEP